MIIDTDNSPGFLNPFVDLHDSPQPEPDIFLKKFDFIILIKS